MKLILCFVFYLLIFFNIEAFANLTLKYSEDKRLMLYDCQGDKCTFKEKLNGDKLNKLSKDIEGRLLINNFFGENRAYKILSASEDKYSSITKDYVDNILKTYELLDVVDQLQNVDNISQCSRNQKLVLAQVDTPVPPNVVNCYPLTPDSLKEIKWKCSGSVISFGNKSKKDLSCRKYSNVIGDEFCKNDKLLENTTNKGDEKRSLVGFFKDHKRLKDSLKNTDATIEPLCSSKLTDRLKACNEAKEKDQKKYNESLKKCPLHPCNDGWNLRTIGLLKWNEDKKKYDDNEIIQLGKDKRGEFDRRNLMPAEFIKDIYPQSGGRGINIAFMETGAVYKYKTNKDGKLEAIVHPDIREDQSTLDVIRQKKQDIERIKEKIKNEKDKIKRKELEKQLADIESRYIPLRLKRAEFKNVLDEDKSSKEMENFNQDMRPLAEAKYSGGFATPNHGINMLANAVGSREHSHEDGDDDHKVIGSAPDASASVYRTHEFPVISSKTLPSVNEGLKDILKENRKLRETVNNVIKENLDVDAKELCGISHYNNLSNWGCWRDILAVAKCGSEIIGEGRNPDIKMVMSHWKAKGAISNIKEADINICSNIVESASDYYKNKTSIVSMSLGTRKLIADNDDFRELEKVTKELQEDGVVLVAAAGNTTEKVGVEFAQRTIVRSVAPCSFEWVICVAGTNALMTAWGNGSYNRYVDFALPADTIKHAHVINTGDPSKRQFSSGFTSGTSYATSAMAGLIARMLSLHTPYALDTKYPQDYSLTFIRELFDRAHRNQGKCDSVKAGDIAESSNKRCAFTPVKCSNSVDMCEPKVELETFSSPSCLFIKTFGAGLFGSFDYGFGNGLLSDFEAIISQNIDNDETFDNTIKNSYIKLSAYKYFMDKINQEEINTKSANFINNQKSNKYTVSNKDIASLALMTGKPNLAKKINSLSKKVDFIKLNNDNIDRPFPNTTNFLPSGVEYALSKEELKEAALIQEQAIYALNEINDKIVHEKRLAKEANDIQDDINNFLAKTGLSDYEYLLGIIMSHNLNYLNYVRHPDHVCNYQFKEQFKKLIGNQE